MIYILVHISIVFFGPQVSRFINRNSNSSSRFYLLPGYMQRSTPDHKEKAKEPPNPIRPARIKSDIENENSGVTLPIYVATSCR